MQSEKCAKIATEDGCPPYMRKMIKKLHTIANERILVACLNGTSMRTTTKNIGMRVRYSPKK